MHKTQVPLVSSITVSPRTKAVPKKLEVTKRDGTVTAFDPNKISIAVRHCLLGLEGEAAPSPTEIESLVKSLTQAVHNILRQRGGAIGVEDIQRLVIQQLWATNQFEAAESYQNYREQRRLLREARPILPEVAARVSADQKHFPTDLQYYQFMSKFSRWRDNDKRRETWQEACYERVLPWLFNRPLVQDKLTTEEQTELASAMYNLEVSPAMRVVQMAGPALNRCEIGAYNCAYLPIIDLFSFAELLYVLMQGTGVGFSVENDYIAELPRLKRQNGQKQFIDTPDTTEGWCDTYHKALQLWWEGWDVDIGVSKIRPAGSRLKTKGGRASGPGPFLELIAYTRNVVMAKQGRHLDDTDVHRICCMIGKIVQVGGVRRAATISLSDLSSQGMRDLKSGNWWERDPYGVNGRHLSMANNSAVYEFEDVPPIDVFMTEWLALMKSGSGERGIFNRKAALLNAPLRRKLVRFGVNPCAEILIRPYGLCNLSIVIARLWDTVESLKRKVRLATIFGVIQSTCTNFQYVRPDWKKNCEDERLLGVDISGHADCPLLRFNVPGRSALLRELKAVVAATRQEFAARFGINESAADTCVKPSGDSGVFFNCASGVTPRFAQCQIRWVREKKNTPVAKFLREAGVPCADAPESDLLDVFGFPLAPPAGATLRDDMTAKQQFFNWLDWKDNWAEHSVSATIHVMPNEWLGLGALVYAHINKITGLSFMPKDNGTYTYAPNEELTKEEYEDMVAKFPQLNWAKLPHYELEDETESSQTLACVGDSCST